MSLRTDKYSVVGKRQPRLDGALKASGRSEFTDDVQLPGILHGKIVRSPIPSGKILNIDTSKAEKLPGVKAVITHKDTGGLMSGSDKLLLCENIVHYFADEVAAVAAVDEDTAQEAAELIKIDYEPITPIFSMEEALAKGAPLLHDFLADNIADEITMNFGDADRAFAESEHIREDEFYIQPTHSAFAEDHIVLADFSLSDRLTVWTPIQSSAIIKSAMARSF